MVQTHASMWTVCLGVDSATNESCSTPKRAASAFEPFFSVGPYGAIQPAGSLETGTYRATTGVPLGEHTCRSIDGTTVVKCHEQGRTCSPSRLTLPLVPTIIKCVGSIQGVVNVSRD